MQVVNTCYRSVTRKKLLTRTNRLAGVSFESAKVEDKMKLLSSWTFQFFIQKS